MAAKLGHIVTEETRRKIAGALTGQKQSVLHKEKNRLGHLGQRAWNKGMIGTNLGHKVNPKSTEAIIKFNKGKIRPIEIINKQRVSLNKYYQEHPEARTKISNWCKNNPILIQRLKENRKKQIFPMHDTSIEVKIQNFLKELGYEFFTHQYMKEIEHGYQCDILIPSMNLVIECDGDYWHKYPIGREIDNIRTKELIEKGFKVLRLWEHEIKIMDITKFKERLI